MAPEYAMTQNGHFGSRTIRIAEIHEDFSAVNFLCLPHTLPLVLHLAKFRILFVSWNKILRLKPQVLKHTTCWALGEIKFDLTISPRQFGLYMGSHEVKRET